MSKVFYTVKKILNEQYSIQLNQIQPEAKFELELGVDSREFFELITDFEKAFNIEIIIEDIMDIVTIQEAVNYIEKRLLLQNSSNNSSL